jgi:hypothetical protein
MTVPKIKPCPLCASEAVSVYAYESGWHYVECDGPGSDGTGCYYRGPGEGSILQAVRSHNERVSALEVSP